MKKDNEYSSGIKLPEQDNYEIAFKEAVQKLVLSDINKISEKSGAKVIQTQDTYEILIKFLNDEISISYPEVKLQYKHKDEEIPLWLQILTLHYLNSSKGTPPTGEEITYKQVPGCLSYYPAFQRRSIQPIIKVFGTRLNALIDAGQKIGGVKSEYGDFSLTFQVFPKIKITYVIWEGDDEFPMEGNVIFDSSISDYLSIEDIAVMCNMISVMMIKKSYS